MTHFHDEDIRKILLEMAPEDKEAIEAQKFGEMLDGYVSDVYCLVRGGVQDSLKTPRPASRAASARTWRS